MSQALQPVRGTHDLLPEAFAQHQFVALTAQAIAARYGYQQMDTPLFEFSDVFHRAVGETSDIVTKETYSFADRGGESLTLRPEFTAAIVRSYISNGLQQHTPFKCFYHGPAFRYERPQKGRTRQFHQIGCELIGSNEPVADVEMIALAMHILRALELQTGATLEINSLGDAASRAAYRDALVAYFSQHAQALSEDSKMRLAKNPLRILDSKNEGDRALIAGAPLLREYFNEASQQHFMRVQDGLIALGIDYKVSDKLVRGLDYYSHTVFEVTTDQLGAQGTVLAGGRYNDLVKLMGGQDTACIGFAAGVERLVALREAMGVPACRVATANVAVIPMQESAESPAWQMVQSLREHGFSVEMGFSGKAGKRLQRADKQGITLAIMLGEEELNAGTVVVKDLASGVQQTIAQEALIPLLTESMK